ncbi:MAG TPA: class I SAM-dependent methyltransferase [Streptosporangiaceae bacterium]|nr:class I SAM-dependent methyltransferase [Streptosporangiaceae bacterium]
MDERLWSAYDQMGADFGWYAQDSTYNAHYDRPAVLAALGDVGGLHVLDAGCGPGLYAAELIAAGARVSAFDASPVMVRLASERTGGRARVDRAVLGDPLPYPDGVFDAALCALAIHHADDRPAAFAELFRVLRPGGALVVSTSHPFMDWLRKRGSYFDVKLETDAWHLASREHQVSFWREPLSALCGAATGAGFLISDVIEPRPAPSMRDRDPRRYEMLSTEPGFLILRLVKPGAAQD